MTLVEELRKRAAGALQDSQRYDGHPLCGALVGKSQAYEETLKLVEADPLYKAAPGLLVIVRQWVANIEELNTHPELAPKVAGGLFGQAKALLATLPKEEK